MSTKTSLGQVLISLPVITEIFGDHLPILLVSFLHPITKALIPASEFIVGDHRINTLGR